MDPLDAMLDVLEDAPLGTDALAEVVADVLADF